MVTLLTDTGVVLGVGDTAADAMMAALDAPAVEYGWAFTVEGEVAPEDAADVAAREMDRLRLSIEAAKAIDIDAAIAADAAAS